MTLVVGLRPCPLVKIISAEIGKIVQITKAANAPRNDMTRSKLGNKIETITTKKVTKVREITLPMALVNMVDFFALVDEGNS